MRSARREQTPPPATGLTRLGPRKARSHLRPVSSEEQIQLLEQVERGRRQLWSVTFLLLFAVSAAVVVVSYWRNQLPPVIADALNFSQIRFVFLVLSASFALYVTDRERRFRGVTRALVDSRARSIALEERLREVSALQQVVAALNSSLEIERVLDVILQQASKLVQASEGAVLLMDPERRTLRMALAFPTELEGEFAVGEDLAGAVARSRLATLVPGPSEVARYPWLAARDIASSMCAPLIAEGELIGALILSATGERRFGEWELRVLMLFAEQAAVAISNAQAFRRERDNVARLADLDKLKTDFIATITHELKTPLTSLLGYASILRKRSADLPEDKRDEFFAIMARQGERILRLIEELLQSSRIEAGEAKLRREPLDLALIVKELESGFSSVSRDHELVFEVPDRDLGLYGDATAIEHVLTNLVENAIKYSPTSTTVRLSVEESDSEVLISVADQGQGIPAEDLPFIFERFRQAAGASRARSSVGLGLYIVKSLVIAHGGRIWADSAEGAGTTFTIAMPRRAGDPGEPLAAGEPAADFLSRLG